MNGSHEPRGAFQLIDQDLTLPILFTNLSARIKSCPAHDI